MSFWKNKIALVTGAHGFTGAHLCRQLLEQGAEVRAFVKNGGRIANLAAIQNQIKIYSGDVTDITSLFIALEGVEYVLNPAAIVPVVEARQSPQSCLQVNVLGSYNVAFAAKKLGVKRMLQISTCHIYGNHIDQNLPIHETMEPKPTDLYAASKYAAELCLRTLMDDNFSILFSRAFAMYGPFQREQYFIPKVISHLLRKEPPQLGNAFPTRDYCYIDDTIRGYLLAIERGKAGEVYHLSSQREIVMRDLYHLIARLMNSDIEPIWNIQNRVQEVNRLSGDSTKARREFNWQPQISLEEGIAKTIAWWKQHPELWIHSSQHFET